MSQYAELTYKKRALLAWMGDLSKKLAGGEAPQELYFDGAKVGFGSSGWKEVALNELLDLESLRFLKVKLYQPQQTAHVSLTNRAWLAVLRGFDAECEQKPSKQELRVLGTAYAEAGETDGRLFNSRNVASVLRFTPDAIVDALNRLAVKGYVRTIGVGMGNYSLTPEGAALIEETQQQPQHNASTHIVNIVGDVLGGVQVGTSRSTQNVTAAISPQIVTGLQRLSDAIQKSELNDLDKEDLLHEISRVEQLASKKDEKAKVKLIERLEAIEKSISISQKLAIIAIPIIAMIRSHYGG